MKKILITMILVMGFAQAEIQQSLGVDQTVDYASLTQYGPWDDRNYQLTKQDLSVIPADDQYLANVPAFFKVFKRKEMPHLGKYYPRATLQHFQILYGGLLVDGNWYKEGLGKGYHPDSPKGKSYGVTRGTVVDADVEVPLANGVSGNEVTIECNPIDNTKCVAGSNQSGGQTMYYSTDSGVTWTVSQTNASSCCDPTVDWSADGSIVYQADLSSGIGVRWSRSLDQGVTWDPMNVITAGGSDKEWIHVDRSPASPHQDNVYLTWHDGNTMQFARSTDMGVSFDATIAFGAEETGIGSDITTDAAGNIYYVYPGLAGGGIRVLKSTDGGATFGTGVQVAPLVGRFDFPIPSMETREAFIYVSVDVDSSDNIYVAFTDEADDSAGGGTGSAAQNHGVIKVAKSTDGGATWSLLPSVHDTSDTIAGTPIDRYHPWLMVGENDAIHVGFYDTRHSVNRTGVDFYYNVSLDGGTTWLPEGEQRFSTETSSNLSDGQEWGDYNGLSVVLDKIAMTWTDNRTSKVAMVGTTDNQFGTPSFNMAATPNEIAVCANDTGNTVSVGLTAQQGYPGIITLSEDSVPTFVNNGAFSVNGQAAPFTSDYTFDVDGSGSTGSAVITIQGSGDDLGDIILKTIDITVNYSAGVAGAVLLTAPADNATDISLQPSFAWDIDPNATSYLIEVATDSAFTSIIVSETVNTNSYDADTDLPSSSDLYWRVTSQSQCGDAVSAVFTFQTSALPGDCAIGLTEIDVYNFTFQDDLIFAHGFEDTPALVGGANAQGWTVDTIVGPTNWALESVGEAGSPAFQADDLAEVNDTSVVSPILTLPTGIGPLTLRFWNTQTIEDGGGNGCFDGGLLEVSVAGGAFVQITDTDIINDVYDGGTDGGFSSPVPPNTQVWCGDPRAATVFNVNVDSNAGDDVQFRFRMVSDSSVGRPEGWAIDNVKVTGCEAP